MGSIDRRHYTSVYLIQLSAEAIPELDTRLSSTSPLPYGLKPIKNKADNCASAAANVLIPGIELELRNINPLAAGVQITLEIGKNYLSSESYDTLISVIRESGLSRSLSEVAHAEADKRESDYAFKQVNPAKNKEDNRSSSEDNRKDEMRNEHVEKVDSEAGGGLEQGIEVEGEQANSKITPK